VALDHVWSAARFEKVHGKKIRVKAQVAMEEA